MTTLEQTQPRSAAPRKRWAFMPNTTLRVRLTLLYTLLAVFSLVVVGALSNFLLLNALERQFQTRLNERADAIVLIWNEPLNNFGRRLIPKDNQALLQIVSNGRIIDGTSSVLMDVREAIPVGSIRIPELGGVLYRAVERISGKVRLWVALPETDLLLVRQTSVQFLLGGTLLSAVFMLMMGLFVGRRTLYGLTRAADEAHALEPFSRSEIALPRRHDELFTLVSAINDLLERIRDQKDFENRFIGQVAHELGAPLTSIQGYLKKAMEKNASSAQPSNTLNTDLEQAQKVAAELNFVAQDLMQLARGRSDITLALHFITAQTLRERLERLTTRVVFTGDWQIYVLCDPDRLVQTLRNLLANARRAAGDTGLVRCDIQVGDDKIIFTVRDSGPGLPQGAEDRIFEAFYSKSNSSGLGLSVASQIAELHGGKLTGRTHPEGGAEFTVQLPQPLEDDAEELLEDDMLEETLPEKMP